MIAIAVIAGAVGVVPERVFSSSIPAVAASDVVAGAVAVVCRASSVVADMGSAAILMVAMMMMRPALVVAVPCFGFGSADEQCERCCQYGE